MLYSLSYWKLTNSVAQEPESVVKIFSPIFFKANEVGGACGTHGRGEKSVQGFGGKARRKETTGETKA
jgi:hypothetical protein